MISARRMMRHPLTVRRMWSPAQLVRLFVSRADNFEVEGAFFKWIRESGRGDISKSVNVRYLPDVGYDLVATADIPKNTTVVSVKKSGWFPYSADFATQEIEKNHPELFRNILSTTNQVLPSQSRETSNLIRSCCLALHLLQQVQSKKSAYANMMASISYPWNPLATPHPLLMNRDDLIVPYLGTTKLMNDITKRQAFYQLFISKLLQEGDTLAYLLSHQFLAHQETDPDPITQYLWAIGLVLSRGLSSPNSPLTVVPFLDFANHTNPLDTNCTHRFDNTTESFELITSRDIRAAESLRISYGEARATDSFMVLYGFAGLDVHAKARPQPSSPHPEEVKNPYAAFPINPNDTFTVSVPVQIVPGKSHVTSTTISPDDFFQIFQNIPPLVLGDITEDILLLYDQIQVNLARTQPTTSTTTEAQPTPAAGQVCEIKFPIHFLIGPSAITTWNQTTSTITLPPSMEREVDYISQCNAVIVDVLLRTRKVADIVAGRGDSISAMSIAPADIQALQQDLHERMNQLVTPAMRTVYEIPADASTHEILYQLERLASETPLPASVLPPHFYWRQNCALYLRQQLCALHLLEQTCSALLDMAPETLQFPATLKV